MRPERGSSSVDNASLNKTSLQFETVGQQDRAAWKIAADSGADTALFMRPNAAWAACCN